MAAEVDAIVTYGAAATFATVRENPGVPVIYAGRATAEELALCFKLLMHLKT